MSFDNVNGGDQHSVTTLFCNLWVSKWRGPTVDVTISKEIYYSTYLPNDVSCTGNDTTVGCNGLWIQPPWMLHNPHWLSVNFQRSKFSIVTEVMPLLPSSTSKSIPLVVGLKLITSGKLVIFQNI